MGLVTVSLCVMPRGRRSAAQETLAAAAAERIHAHNAVVGALAKTRWFYGSLVAEILFHAVLSQWEWYAQAPVVWTGSLGLLVGLFMLDHVLTVLWLHTHWDDLLDPRLDNLYITTEGAVPTVTELLLKYARLGAGLDDVGVRRTY